MDHCVEKLKPDEANNNTQISRDRWTKVGCQTPDKVNLVVQMTACVLFVICLVYIHQLHTELRQQRKDIEVLLTRIQQFESRGQNSIQNGAHEGEISPEKSHVMVKRASNGRPRNHRLRNLTRMLQQAEEVQQYLDNRWRQFSHAVARISLEYSDPGEALMMTPVQELFDTANYQLESGYKALTIKTTGRYKIDAQVTYNGRRMLQSSPCAFLLKSHTLDGQSQVEDTKLLYGATTQYKLGQPIEYDLEGYEVFAFDSVFTSGVFHLRQGNRIFVVPTIVSQDCNIIARPHQTFLNVLKVN